MNASPEGTKDRANARVGQVLRGKWRLDELLAVGGMASVFAATHRNGKRGAVKLLHYELSLNDESRTRFLREGYVANKVDHEGAVSVLDDDICEDGTVFLVMELLDGLTVDSLLRTRNTKTFGLGETLRVADRLLDVLIAAHAKGVVHRDIKPENLFITKKGVLKVLDFGIARLREAAASAGHTRAGDLLGTPNFMPPEQALGNTEQVDARSDLWSVGATIFRLLTGRPVHHAESINRVLLAAMTVPAQPIRRVLPTVPAQLAMIVDRALSF
jgi:serine/threonine protein kinase